MYINEGQLVQNPDLLSAIYHGMLVSKVAFLIAAELDLPEDMCYDMAKAGMVHDIGKLRLGKYLYSRKSDTLKIEEMKYIRMHPTLGYETLMKTEQYSPEILEAIYHHHENFDGSGYPNNLKGYTIPYGARILRVCDVFAALVSSRPYRRAFDIDSAVELMIDEVKNFDMKIFLAFLRVIHAESFCEIKAFIEEINERPYEQVAVGNEYI